MISEEKILEASKLAVMKIFAEGFAKSKNDLIDQKGLEHVGKALINLVQSSFWQGYYACKKDTDESVVKGQ